MRVGIDENGLGPRLGPLVVTAVVAHTHGTGDRTAESRARGKLKERLGDSKKLVSHGDTALGEAWARAIARRMGGGDPASPEALVDALSIDPGEELRKLCPPDHERQCWCPAGETFTAEVGQVDTASRDLDRLTEKGVVVERAAMVVTCTRRLNDGVDLGLSRFDKDLHAMERLALDARARAGEDIAVTCGKVGGFDRYAPSFGPLAGRLHAVVVEGRARSEYSFPGLGRLAFVRDADDRHMLVSLASLVGKWARDLLMARIVRYHRERDADLPDASGYHDPVTARFVAASRLSRRERALPDACFERRALQPRAVPKLATTTAHAR